MHQHSLYHMHEDPLVTVILPVYNSPWLAEQAFFSAIHTKNITPFKMAVHDDGSDSFTKSRLTRITDCSSDRTELYTLQKNIGFIKTVNSALQKCPTRYALILNSDVVLGDYWLDNMVATAESDERIATVNPLTNRASQIETPLPPGVNFLEVNRYLQKYPAGALDVVTGVGFCMLLRMKALHDVGFLDEIFGAGYCEESDLCMRLTTNGWRTVVAPNVYAYHKGSGSFTHRRERYLHNRRIFDDRWQWEYKTQFDRFKKNNPLQHVRSVLAPPRRWDPIAHARQTYRLAHAAIKRKRPSRAIKELIKGGLSLPNAHTPVVSRRHIRKFKSGSGFSATYILPHITMAGGVISVIQLVNELILKGIDARIATLHIYPEMDEWAQYFGPMVFRNYQDMAKRFVETDIAIATHWSTASSVLGLQQNGRARRGAYFVQDYEPWFFPKEDHDNRQRVKETYRKLPIKIVKSDWLAKMLKPFGGEIHKIRLGMDLGIYYPRDRRTSNADNPPVVLAMARPRTPRRGFATLVKALKSLKKQFPEMRIRLFGDDLMNQSIPFPYEDLGIVVSRNALCQTYSDADIFIDASDFQGFGRPALEAMACGTACVVTDVGGVNEYARDRANALMVPPKAPDEIIKAVAGLIHDIPMRERLVKAGLQTVRDYCHKREAQETAELLKKICASQR